MSEITFSDVQYKQKDLQNNVRVKICGITSVTDASMVVNAGADAIGLNFYKPSPRYVDIAQASEIAYTAGAFVTTVGLFVNEEKHRIDQVLEEVPLQVLQFHGDESADFCEQFHRPYVKAIRMREGLNVQSAIAEHPNAVAILLDAYRPGTPGGTGETFDWQRIPVESSSAIVLAGGLNPDNVKSAIEQTHPYAVDVSGGVEVSPGQKDPVKVAAFINNTKATQ